MPGQIAMTETQTETKEKDKDDAPPKPKLGSRPPKEGPCKRCGNDRPLNRLFLCYKCWVITNIEDEAKSRGETWTSGQPHPAWCKCEGLGAHPDQGGSWQS